ncbi:hypothetical protein DL95DRAFT_502701 [Leptodontidium sp. 2 PMI_412]|nr:hypothetical protein DL95DRAFT_502701 [Leptodontidium sp. 2 PMI_412]
MMQSTNVQELHKKAPENPIPPLIIGSTNMGNPDPPLPTAESINEEKPSPRLADSIVIQTEDNLVAVSEQAFLGQQAHDQNKDVSSAQQNYELDSQQETIPDVHPENDSAVQHLPEDEDDHSNGVNDHTCGLRQKAARK